MLTLAALFLLYPNASQALSRQPNNISTNTFWTYRVELAISDTLIGDLLLHLNTTLKRFQYEITLLRKLALSLLACWLLIFLSLSKGVKSLGKVSYITAIFPYIMIIALIIRGVTLKGAMKGIEFYILNINTEKLWKLEVIIIC